MISLRRRRNEETVEKLTRARMDVEESLRVPYQSEMAVKTMTTKIGHGNLSLSQTHSSTSRDFILQHRIGTEFMPICFFLPFPTPTQIPTSTSRGTRTGYPSPTFAPPTSTQLIESTVPSSPFLLSRCPHPVSSGMLTVGSSILS